MKRIFMLLNLLITINSYAQPEIFDIVSYQPPKGWKQDKTDERVSFSNGKGKFFSVLGLYKSRLVNAVTESEFITEWNDLVNLALSVNVAPVLKRTRQNGYNIFSASANITTTKNGNYNVQLISYTTEDKIISAMIYSSNDNIYKKEADAFLASVTLLKKDIASNIKTPISGKAEIKPANNTDKENRMDNSGINGVWVGYENGKYVFGVTSYDYVNNRNNYGSTYKAAALAIKWRVFWSDGKYYDGMPFRGLINYDRSDPKNDYAGSYKMEKNIVSTSMDHYAHGQRMYVFYPPAKLKFLDKYEYVKCQPVDGLKLNGIYMSADPMSPAYYHSLGKPIATISFTVDGYFTDDNYLSDYSDEPELAPGSGTYEIKNFTITFKFNDGRIIQRSFTPFLNESPATCKIFYIGSRDIKLKP